MTLKVLSQDDDEMICFVIQGCFKVEECDDFLNLALPSFQKAITNYPTYYRNNERYVVKDESFAETLFHRTKRFLPANLKITNSTSSENGVWQLISLNPLLRYCKYNAEEYFRIHKDGVYHASSKTPKVQSKLTFLLYLNDFEEYEGGKTIFYNDKLGTQKLYEYCGRKGDVIVFNHNIWHEGQRIDQGVKYILRSDYMFTFSSGNDNECDISPQKKDDQLHHHHYDRREIDVEMKENEYEGGHEGYIWAMIEIGNDQLVSSGRDCVIRIWNKRNRKCEDELRGHSQSILCLAAFDQNTLLSGSRDYTVLLWKKCCNNNDDNNDDDDDSESEREGKFEVVRSWRLSSSVILSICILNERMFAASCGDSKIYIVDIEDGVLRTLCGHSNWVWNIKLLSLPLDIFSSSSSSSSPLPSSSSSSLSVLVSCSEDKTIRVWDYEKAECMLTIDWHYPIYTFTIMEDRRSLLFGDGDGHIVFYSFMNCDSFVHAPHFNILNYHHLFLPPNPHTIEDNVNSINSDNNLHCSSHLHSSSRSGISSIGCDGKSGDAHCGIIRSIVQIGESCFASGGEDNNVKLWRITNTTTTTTTTTATQNYDEDDRNNWELVHTYHHQNFVQQLIYDRSDRTLISCSYDGVISTWKTNLLKG